MTAKIMGALDAGMNFLFGIFATLFKKVAVLVILTAVVAALVTASLMATVFVVMQ